MARKPTSDQRAIVERLLDLCADDTSAYRRQLEEARVRPACGCGCPSFSFVWRGTTSEEEIWGDPLVDAYAITPEGHEVGVLLFVGGDRLREVEIYPNDDVGGFELPDPTAVRVYG